MSTAETWYVGMLPTFEEIRQEAFRQIGEVLDTLRLDWLPNTGPTDDQAVALRTARRALARAQEELDGGW